MRVLVCGGRKFTDWAVVKATLDALHLFDPITAIIHGCADGADMLADRWGREHGLRPIGCPVHKSDWKRLGKAAGAIRNGVMLAQGRPDYVVAFPGGPGTGDMMVKARAAGLEVIEVSPRPARFGPESYLWALVREGPWPET